MTISTTALDSDSDLVLDARPALLAAVQSINNRPMIKDFGAAADGTTDDTAAVNLAEASAFDFIDLGGGTVRTTLTSVTKNYFNGDLIILTAGGKDTLLKPQANLSDRQLARPRTKTPIIDWSGKSVLWLGTSIPYWSGSDGTSYPNIIADTLGFTVDNMGYPGSTACFDPSLDEFDFDTVKCLSMTEDDRAAYATLYGPTSAYADGFLTYVKASWMTADYRIRDRFALTPFDCVMLDHNHNDRFAGPGVLNPTAQTVTAVTKGANTQITIPGHTFAVGDAIAAQIQGITKLNYVAGRVQAVAGNVVTISINSSGYAGTFTSGVAYEVDRTTVYGAWDFLIHYIKWCVGVYGNTDCKIVLCGTPNEWTDGSGVQPNNVYSNARYIKDVADKWGLAFFDIAHYMDVQDFDKELYFPDGLHPTTLAARQVIANHWIDWMSGGVATPATETGFLAAGQNTNYTEQREALYSKWMGGFGTPDVVTGAESSLGSLDFTATYTGWTTTGVVPTRPASPWDGANTALRCQTTAVNVDSGIYKSLAYGQGRYVEFDVYLPTVAGLATANSLVTLARLGQGVGPATTPYYAVQLYVRPDSITPRVSYVPVVGGGSTNLTAPRTLDEDTVYNIRVEMYQATAAYDGVVLLYIDGELVAADYAVGDSSRSSPAYMAFGALDSTTGANFDVYLDNLDTGTFTVSDYTTRADAVHYTTNGKKATFVNGVLTKSETPSAAEALAAQTSLATGSYTGTATGLTTSPTGSITYCKHGNLVTLEIPAGFTGTSNATTFTITGASIPTEIKPSTVKYCPAFVTNNGTQAIGQVKVNVNGTLIIERDPAGTNWTSSGTKALHPVSITYLVP